MGDLDITNQDFATPKRVGTFDRLDNHTRKHLETLIKYMREPLTEKKDKDPGIVYAAKGCGSKVGDSGYIKVGFSKDADDTRVKAIQKCNLLVDQHFHTLPFKGAYRAEQILLKMFKPQRHKRLCECRKDPVMHHEWFNKDLAVIRHWILTLYLWFLIRRPYDFETRELKQEWQHESKNGKRA